MKQLTKNQIKELFTFTKAHRIRYYDLQSEVVDHLASAIETKWEDHPTMSFQKALDEVYAGFGIYGFGKLEQEKRDAIHRKIGWKVWAFVKSYLTPPKILMTLLAIIATHQGLSFLDEPYKFSEYLIFIFFLCFLGIVLFQKKNINHLKEKYLEVNAIYTGSAPVLILFYVLVDISIVGDILPREILWVLATWLVVSLLAAVGIYNYLMQTVEEVEVRYE